MSWAHVSTTHIFIMSYLQKESYLKNGSDAKGDQESMLAQFHIQ